MYFSYCVYVHVRIMCLLPLPVFHTAARQSFCCVFWSSYSVIECFLGMKVMHFIVVVTFMFNNIWLNRRSGSLLAKGTFMNPEKV